MRTSMLVPSVAPGVHVSRDAAAESYTKRSLNERPPAMTVWVL